VHSEATDSQLVLMTIMKKIQGYGFVSISQMTYEQEKLLNANIELNAISTDY
jgi:hypothetical protein